MDLTPELIIKHRRLIEAEVTVKSHTRHSKKGKTFNVKQFSRSISVTHMGEKFKLDNNAFPERHIMTLRKIASREIGLHDRIDANLKSGLYDSIRKTKSEIKLAKEEALRKKEAAKKRALAATDLMLHINSLNPSGRNVGMTAKNIPSAGGEELKANYDTVYKRMKK